MSGDVSGDGVDAAAGHSSNGTTFLSLATGSERNSTSPHVTGSKVGLLPNRDSDLFLALKESRRDVFKAGKWRAVDWFGQRSGGW